MKASDIKVGGHYQAKVAGRLTTVRVDSIGGGAGRHKGYDVSGKSKGYAKSAVYGVTNLTTGRKTTFRSAAKFRAPAAPGGKKRRPPSESLTAPTASPTPTTAATATKGSSAGRKTAPATEGEQGRPPSSAATSPSTSTPAAEADECECPQSADGNHEYEAGECRWCGEARPQPKTDLSAFKKMFPELAAKAQAESDRQHPLVDYRGDDYEPPPQGWKPGHVAKAAAKATAGSVFQRKLAESQRRQEAVSSERVPHVEVSALAGTGKTTTVIEGMAAVKGVATTVTPSPQQAAVWEQMKMGRSDRIRFMAFGNAIAATLKEKLAARGLAAKGCEASTLHSFGFSVFRQAFGYRKPDENAVEEVIEKVLGIPDIREYRRDPLRREVVKATVALVGYCKQSLCDATPENLDRLVDHFDVTVDAGKAEVYQLVPDVLEACKTPGQHIAFDDMVWLPLVHNLPVPKSDMGIIDESQDLNRMQQELAYRSAHRLAYVGDRHQAIFGFAGADERSMERMAEYLGGTPRGLTTLPLTVTRRCGKAIVEEAKKYVPEYEAHPDNGPGLVSRAPYPGRGRDMPELPWEQTYAPAVRGGDMVLCRCNAPLVSQCFKFVRRRIKANILGRKIGDGLVSLVQRLKARDVPDLVGKLDDWMHGEVAKEEAKRFPSESRIEQLEDKHDCVLAFTEGASGPDAVVASINEVFTDRRDAAGVLFSSIHRAKGQEARRVFYLQPPGVGPREDKMKPWELTQENNLRYVAVTRAIEELIHVT